MKIKQKIDLSRIPKHVAIIMDGNGRWAKDKGKNRIFGHKNGVKSVKQSIEACLEIGVKNLTLYAFSTENWNRPKLEVTTLMSLLVESLKKELQSLHKNNIRLQAIGNLKELPKRVENALEDVIAQTQNNSALTLTLALSYGSRTELISAVKKISEKVVNNQLSIKEINEKVINNHLYTFTLPDVDFLIRTSGEKRISNFLLWQIAYAELYFTDTLWPDFTKQCMFNAIIDFQNRERRFGKTSEQVNHEIK